jgi:hypothetical protein
MPVRSTTEIAAKAAYRLNSVVSGTAAFAHSRAVALSMLACYPHNAEIRMLGLAACDATDSQSVFISPRDVPGRLPIAWSAGERVIDIISRLMGPEVSKFPLGFPIRDWKQIGYYSAQLRSRFTWQGEGVAAISLRSTWKKLLRLRVVQLREDLSRLCSEEERPPPVFHDDLYQGVSPPPQWLIVDHSPEVRNDIRFIQRPSRFFRHSEFY